jgi:hypothetical protein
MYCLNLTWNPYSELDELRFLGHNAKVMKASFYGSLGDALHRNNNMHGALIAYTLLYHS